ncbi:MAG: S8 family peptidase [Actinomycetes bacterium]
MRLAHKAATSIAAVGALLLLGAPVASSDTTGTTGSTETYLVLAKQQALSADTTARVAAAGGKVVVTYPEIGVLVARSDRSDFPAAMSRDTKVESVNPTSKYKMRIDGTEAAAQAEAAPPGDLPSSPATDTDTLSGLQWDMRQIKTPQAHAITGGSPAVLVGDLDSGLDYTHPDLAANVDFANSTSCDSGVSNPSPAAWKDDNGHGTHTAGTIAAAANGIGIVGVAPNVKIAAVKTGNTAGFFYPENVVCAFMWAGSHHFDVTNNSYFADPYLYNCKNDPVQRAIYKAESRAIQWAQKQGVTVVAANGNESDDLAHPSVDATSPDDATPITRDVTNACAVVPVEVPGVIGVSAVGSARQVDGDNDPNDFLKSYYSSYGVGVTDVTAPGGDFYYGRSADSVNGLVLSTWPSYKPCARSVQEDQPAPGQGPTVYCYLQGTSMASPHAAGLAALIISRYGDASSPQNGKLRPGQVAAIMQQTADPQPCPTETPASGAPGSSHQGVPYSATTQTSGAPQICQGGPGYNSWYGNGQINALSAVTK